MVDDELSMARLGVMSEVGAGDTGAAYRLIVGLMHDGHPFPAILEDVLAPIQSESGRRWEVGDYSVADEHVSTSTVETLVAMLGGAFDQPPGAGLVAIVCAEGETHTLPARMAAALLAYEGFRTLFLGPSVPAADLADLLETAAPDALVVSCTRPANLPGARACVEAGHGAKVPVIVGGRAFGEGDDRAVRLGADAHAPRLGALPDILAGWDPDPEQAEARTTVPAGNTVRLEAARGPVVVAMTRLCSDAGPETDPAPTSLTGDLGDLFDTLVAAVYLADHMLLAEHAVWLSGVLAVHGPVAVAAPRLLDCLARALADVEPAALPLIARATRTATPGSADPTDPEGAGDR